MRTQVSIDDIELYVCEDIDMNFEEAYMEEINGSADKCRVRRGELQAGPNTSSRSTEGRNEALPEDASVQEGTSPEMQRCDREDAQVPRLAGRQRV